MYRSSHRHPVLPHLCRVRIPGLHSAPRSEAAGRARGLGEKGLVYPRGGLSRGGGKRRGRGSYSPPWQGEGEVTNRPKMIIFILGDSHSLYSDTILGLKTLEKWPEISLYLTKWYKKNEKMCIIFSRPDSSTSKGRMEI